MNTEHSPDTVILEHGRLTARPGPDLYLHTFKCATVPLPEIGQRGLFRHGEDSIAARVTDSHGPNLTLCLHSGQTLGTNLSGSFQPNPAAPIPEPRFDESLKSAPGARQFLDARDGWVMELTEAASQKQAVSEAAQWPAVPLAELPHRLSPAGLTFVWRQSPDPATGLEARLAEYLTGFGRVLVLGDSPADLEAVAGLPEAFFFGPAAPGTPLHPISVYTKMAEALRAKEVAQAELRNQLSDLNRAESALKAELGRWDDLAALEKRFKEMGREVEGHKRRWNTVRQNLESARLDWEDAGLAMDKSSRGLLGFFKKNGPGERALRLEGERRKQLEEAESRVAHIRQEEENFLENALNLEKRLRGARLDSQAWKSREEVGRAMADLREKEAALHTKIAAVAARPLPGPEEMLAAAPLVLALAADLAPGEALHQARFSGVLALCSAPPDHQGRLNVAALALAAEEQLVVAGDFTFWPVWRAKAPGLEGRPDTAAWACLKLAEEADELKQYLASGGPFVPGAQPFEQGPRLARLEPGPEWLDFETANFNYIVQPAGSTAAPSEGGPAPLPSMGAGLRRKKRVTSAVPAFGMGLRAFGEIGPANPVSALMAARAAINAEKEIPGRDPAVIILTASPAQSRLVSQMLKDLEATPGRIYSGEPQDFRHWPKAPLVILEPAFEAPHVSHPWAWPAFGRQRLSLAWRLAEERVWLAGRDAWMHNLPGAAPLFALWQLAAKNAPEANPNEPRRNVRPPSFWEALDKAKKTVWAIVPTFEPFWWRPLEEHFLAAARRRVQVTILSAPPSPGQDREYPSAAIRTLSAYGCAIHLANGFPGFMAVVDDVHFTWGHFVEGSRGAHIWGGLKSAELPLAAPALGDIVQIQTINERLGRKSGGLKNCRVCGWPMVLINEEAMRGYGDEQPLKVGCLGDHGGKFPRRLDEREPFLSPPRCGVDHHSLYQRRGKGRAAVWVCPHHSDDPRCPVYKVVPGDVP